MKQLYLKNDLGMPIHKSKSDHDYEWNFKMVDGIIRKGRGLMKKLLILVVGAVLLGVDLYSKAWIETNLRLGEIIPVISNFFEITYLRNTGAAWSMFDASWMRPIFLLISAGVTLVGFYYFIKERDTLLLWGIGLILSGNLGNFYDRLTLGYVRDMLSFNIFGYDFPVFNVADSCLVVGVGVLFLYMFLEERKLKNNEA